MRIINTVANKKRICFVGLDNYPVLNPETSCGYFGGESVQQTLLAKAFSSLGYEVSMVVKDHGQQDGETREGVRVWKAFAESDGLPGLRFFYPRLSSIWRALKKADADIYYQSCAGALTGIVAHFCKRRGRQFVFRLAHDTDCIPGEQLIRLWRDRKLYEYGLRNAGIIAAQGTNQVELLRKYYGLISVPVNMAVELPEQGSCPDSQKTIDVLWVNNLRDFKRPDIILEVAKALPQYRFTMIGGEVRGFRDLFEAIASESKGIENVEFLGSVPYKDVNRYFALAKLFLNTSDTEGFPNSYLQAWVRRTPTIAFFDPDHLIRTHDLGLVAGDFDEMVQSIRMLLDDSERRREVAERAERFVMANFAPDVVAGKYQDLVNERAIRSSSH